MTVTGKTIYEKIHFLYCRTEKNVQNIRRQKFAVCSDEDAIQTILDNTSSEMQDEKSGIYIRTFSDVMVMEKDKGNSIVGVVTECFQAKPFDLWFVSTILDNSIMVFDKQDLNTQMSNLALDDAKEMATKITEIFETTVKNSAKVDRWSEGRDSFIKNVQFFTSRNAQVEAVLPAFPCKSSNPEKVASTTPDKGEELALKRIIEFVSYVNEIYPPGMKFFIVSDGHVFSDCINVDDKVVDSYTEQLKKLYHRVKPEGFDGIHFRGLNDCFKSSTKNEIAPLLNTITVDHYLDTQLDYATEINRKIMMLGCDDNAETLREEIKTPSHPRLYLYRGFNKFMYEDLVNTPKAQAMSRKKFKKMVSSIAFEMILRNDAYSNLVELVFPFHLRLSIHAHHNAGPKYGIRLLDTSICCSYDHNPDEEDRLLHIPTPWHNAVFKLGDREKMIVSNSKLAEMLEKDEKYVGGWHEKERCFVYAPSVQPNL
ncbi:dityrosine synthesis enzyme [Clavispora lusitaniae]|nr:dityrosine synthesis enzyme [Clavispora lusitaniae]